MMSRTIRNLDNSLQIPPPSTIFLDFQGGGGFGDFKNFSGGSAPGPPFIIIKPTIEKRVKIDKFSTINYLMNAF